VAFSKCVPDNHVLLVLADSRVAVRVLERGRVKAHIDLESKRQLEVYSISNSLLPRASCWIHFSLCMQSEMRDQDDEDEEELPPAKRTRGNRELSGLDSVRL
jgi:hypothetical protein